MSDLAVLRALLAHVDTFAPSPPVDVAWPNLEFRPQPDVPYLRVDHVPAATTRETASALGHVTYQGVLSVVVSWPYDRGSEDAHRIATLLAQHFAPDTKLTDAGVIVNIVQAPAVGAATQTHPRYEVPVTIPYVAYVQNF